MKKSTILLDLTGAQNEQLLDHDLRDGLSSATRTGKYVWVAGDEQICIQRLEKTGADSYGNCVTFNLADYIQLISNTDEADIEGMDFDGKYLWIIGSHSYKRSNIRTKKATENPEKEIKRLTKISMDPNRILLARIPCIADKKGIYELHQSCPDPDNPQEMLTAAKLKHDDKTSELSKALKKDKHLAPFLKIPGKDNGFDIEGLAAYQDRLFIGLRGPVLRGWAIILEVRLGLTKKNNLKLQELVKKGARYRKFFVDLHGMGVRELAAMGDDLLILAGPTMDLDGSMAVYRWKNILGDQPDQLISQEEIEEIVNLPYRSSTHGINKAEGMVMLEDGALLLVYDSPGKNRLVGEHGVQADVYQIKEEEKLNKED
ncbi:MAG: DUF3616 domain-containing protein [Bacteroidetes bacterium]|nr:DUF3616 domain-containing protein [Bacteroidota bacterium]